MAAAGWGCILLKENDVGKNEGYLWLANSVCLGERQYSFLWDMLMSDCLM
jgi:hypothetical protein